MPVPTIFLVVNQGTAARLLLRSDVFRTLRAGGAKIVVVAPNPDEDYLVEEFAGEGVALECHDEAEPTPPPGRPLVSLFYLLRQYSLGGGEVGATIAARYGFFIDQLRKDRPLVARAFAAAVGLLRRSRVARRALLALESLLVRDRPLDPLYEKHDPDLVVAVSPGWFFPDALVLREARRRGVATAVVVLGWDNPSSKGYLGARPDTMIAWSQAMADELVELHDYPRERIVVAGPSQFDYYAQPDELPGREATFARLGLDLERRLVFFAARSPGTYGHNALVAKALAAGVEQDGFPPAQVVVRPHPAHFDPVYDGVSTRALEQVCEDHPHAHFDRLDILSRALARDLPESDQVGLAALVRHCDVLVNVFSTTTLEAFLVDRPVVLVASDAHARPGDLQDVEPSFAAEPRRFEGDTHFQRILAAEAAPVARSMPELLEHVRDQLERPDAYAERRAAVVHGEAGQADGHAARRVGEHLLALARGRQRGSIADLDEEELLRGFGE